MKKSSLSVTCIFSGEEELEQILLRSFYLYVHRILAEQRGKRK